MRALISCAIIVLSQIPAVAIVTFDPRTMTLAQIEAATGIQGEPPLMEVGEVTITEPGVYEKMNVRGRVTIISSDVILRNNRIKGDADYAVLVDPHPSPSGTIKNVIIENNDISASTNCVAGAFTLARRNDISGCDNGFNTWAPNQEIVENYIHIGEHSNNIDPHFDGIENNGSSGMRVIRNYIVLNSGQTSAVMMNNEFGSITSGEIAGNYLAGGAYTIYCDNRRSQTAALAGSNIAIRNNTIKLGVWGPLAAYSSRCALDASNQLIK